MKSKPNQNKIYTREISRKLDRMKKGFWLQRAKKGKISSKDLSKIGDEKQPTLRDYCMPSRTEMLRQEQPMGMGRNGESEIETNSHGGRIREGLKSGSLEPHSEVSQRETTTSTEEDPTWIEQRRNNFAYETRYPGMRATPIELKETRFSLSKKQTSASSTATATQFPLKLAYAATAHKIRGTQSRSQILWL